jgi:ElaB/YqjD/DUF883 family membrane-anchored ribosome-binding protein
METLLTIFIAVTAAAVVIQMIILIALYAAVKRSSSRMESLADEVERRALPALDAAQSLLVGSRPKLEIIVDNLTASTTKLRGQIERLDATMDDIVDRTRLQIIRADEMVSRTLDKVEETTDFVHHTVVSPVRQVSGLVQGVAAGFGALFGRKRKSMGAPQDEMFI